ncbi:MAG: hypothetical protein ACLR7U_04495 [Ruthenibacterium lactatiformans]
MGVANYARCWARRSGLAAGNTARFIGVCVPAVRQPAGRGSARRKDGGRIFKTTYLIPMAIPVASIAAVAGAVHRQGLVNAAVISWRALVDLWAQTRLSGCSSAPMFGKCGL